MDVIIYHSKDLDGVSSGALAHFVWPDAVLIGYDYSDKPLDLRKFKNKRVLMVDVSLDTERMFQLINIVEELVWVDHHLSAYDDFINMCGVANRGFDKKELNSFIDLYSFPKLYYYYSTRLAACEMVLLLFGNETLESSEIEQSVKLLGQYDTWRNTLDRQLVTDKDWDREVLPYQWGMRGSLDVERLKSYFEKISSWMSGYSLVRDIEIGQKILFYQRETDKVNIEKNVFEFDFEFQGKKLRVVALNGGPFNSGTFDSVWNEDYFDIMMPFVFNGKSGLWSFSMYTTKDVDIISIAKSFGGGGHKQACGFALKPEEVLFKDGIIKFKKTKQDGKA
jgi:oligoribonuclease NrnB/cAMP/cGMP phosphodiesterase (DHH superfamily)